MRHGTVALQSMIVLKLQSSSSSGDSSGPNRNYTVYAWNLYFTNLQFGWLVAAVRACWVRVQVVGGRWPVAGAGSLGSSWLGACGSSLDINVLSRTTHVCTWASRLYCGSYSSKWEVCTCLACALVPYLTVCSVMWSLWPTIKTAPVYSYTVADLSWALFKHRTILFGPELAN